VTTLSQAEVTEQEIRKLLYDDDSGMIAMTSARRSSNVISRSYNQWDATGRASDLKCRNVLRALYAYRDF
jgi:hypothetical protein